MTRSLLSSESADYDPKEDEPVLPHPAIRSNASDAAAGTFPAASSERAGTAALDGICHVHPKNKLVQKIEDESYHSCAMRQKMISQKESDTQNAPNVNASAVISDNESNMM